MPALTLTNAVIEKACRAPPALGKTRYLRDAKVVGLGVRIHPTGQGSFVVFMPGGARPKLGRPFMHKPGPEALEEARQEAARKLRAIYEQAYPRRSIVDPQAK